MRTFLALIAGLALLSSADVWSQTPADPGRDTPSAEDQTQMDAEAMQQRMLRMHALMHEALDTQDPDERRRKMDEHREVMQEMMRSMQARRASGGMPHGGMMGGDGMMGKRDQTPPEKAPRAGADPVEERVEALEQQVQQLEQQLARLRAEP